MRDAVAVEGLPQSLGLSPLAGGHETTVPRSAEALPLPPLLDQDEVPLGEQPPPLGAPRPDRLGADGGDPRILPPGLLDPSQGGGPAPEVPGGLAVHDVSVGEGTISPGRGAAAADVQI